MMLRIAAAFLALSCVAAAQQVVAAGARVEGQVTSVTGEPLIGASVQLQGTSLPPYIVETDAGGNFVVENVAPGNYSVEASRSGYARARYTGLVSVAAGQVKNGLAMRLTPGAAISGKVTGADAEPMEKAKVTLYRRTWTGRWELQFVKDLLTALDGTFQVDGMVAGRYYVFAEESSPKESAQPASDELYVPTFYPSALDASAALPVQVSPGEQTRVEIRMRKERAYHIRGRAINAVTGAPATDVVVQIAPASSDASVGVIPPKAGLVRKENGSFEFDRLLPGPYVISTGNVEAHVGGRDPQSQVPLVGRQTVNLANLDVEDLTLNLAPPVGITGTIRIDGVDPQPTLRVGVSLIATDVPSSGKLRDSHPVQTKADDGTFLIPMVAPGTYAVNFEGLPSRSYVKSMRYGGQYLLNGILDNTSAPGGSLEITLSPDVADLSGTVQNDSVDGAPRMLVTLWAPGIIFSTQSTAKGAFRFPNLPPGNYYVVAWEQVDRTLVSIPDFLARFENQATSLTLGPKDRGMVQVKIVKRDAVEAEAARFR